MVQTLVNGGADSLVPVQLTKERIVARAKELGAEFVGFAPVDKWQHADVAAEFYPHKIWPQTRAVVVLGVPLWLSIEQTLSLAIAKEQEKVTSDLLDEAAYRTAVFLNNKGYPSVNIPCDSNGENITDFPTVTVFSHVWAAHYAGLGQITQNKVSAKWRPGTQWNLASILTAFELESEQLGGS